MKILHYRKISLAELLPYVVALAMAVGLKHHYSRAGSEDLLWILLPTTRLVEWLTGLSFLHHSSAGFIHHGSGIAIAPPCSGVNFLIIALMMSFFSFAHHYRPGKDRWRWLLITLVSSYLLTIAVNSVRIVLSIFSILHGIQFGGLTPDGLHRLEGVVVYFSFLSLFYLILKGCAAPDRRCKKSGSEPKTFIAMTPLCWYLLFAVVVPILTGHWREQGMRFGEHVIMMGAACTAVMILMNGIQRFIGFIRNHHQARHGDM